MPSRTLTFLQAFCRFRSSSWARPNWDLCSPLVSFEVGNSENRVSSLGLEGDETTWGVRVFQLVPAPNTCWKGGSPTLTAPGWAGPPQGPPWVSSAPWGWPMSLQPWVSALYLHAHRPLIFCPGLGPPLDQGGSGWWHSPSLGLGVVQVIGGSSFLLWRNGVQGPPGEWIQGPAAAHCAWCCGRLCSVTMIFQSIFIHIIYIQFYTFI